MFFGSAGIGTLVAMLSSLVLKYIDLYTNPSLEFALMLCFVYVPYALAEGLHLSGIMAILFCGIGMSHYTHYNLSPVTQITMQQTMRTMAFVCESCVFVYLGLGIFSFPHMVEPSLVVWSLVLVLAGRALNIFPLATLCNKFRSHQITKRMMVIMWFSGLRGAIAYALCLHLEFEEEVRKVLVTTTLIVVLFTTIVLGGGTMPLVKYLESRTGPRHRRRRKREVTLSKTREFGAAIDSEHMSELTETEAELEQSFAEGRTHLQGFLWWDYQYLRPFFIRKFTQQELKDGKLHVTELTDKWFQDIQTSPLMSNSSSEIDLHVDQD
jgi:sodium/hydrogen exchanger 8